MAAGSRKNKSQANDAWYTEKGKDEDVVLSTKVRLSRNLANFPFPEYEKGQQVDRVLSIIYDVFNHLDDAERFQSIKVSDLDDLGQKILEERGVLQTLDGQNPGLVIRNDGKVSCQINSRDHIRISSYKTGFDPESTFKESKDLDNLMQTKVQFAASWDFGYLTSCLDEAGSGMKLSSLFHLPGLSLEGKIWSFMQKCRERGYILSSTYGAGKQGMSLGSYYTITNLNSLSGSEEEQIAAFYNYGKEVIEMEKTARKECEYNKMSLIKDMVYRAFALSKYSLFMPVRESVEVISNIKLGKDLNLLNGIDDNILNALLYRIQDGHLEYVLKNGDFDFPGDIAEDSVKKNERLRCLILQEAVEKVSVV